MSNVLAPVLISDPAADTDTDTATDADTGRDTNTNTSRNTNTAVTSREMNNCRVCKASIAGLGWVGLGGCLRLPVQLLGFVWNVSARVLISDPAADTDTDTATDADTGRDTDTHTNTNPNTRYKIQHTR